jgi:hypothetical protein
MKLTRGLDKTVPVSAFWWWKVRLGGMDRVPKGLRFGVLERASTMCPAPAVVAPVEQRVVAFLHALDLKRPHSLVEECF